MSSKVVQNMSDQSSDDRPSEKVGDSSEAARKFGGLHDFGAKESNRTEREYASNAIRAQDPGRTPERRIGHDDRTSGVGGNESGPGSSSGGDLDPDFVGLANNAGIATSGKLSTAPGPDDAQTKTTEHTAVRPPAVTVRKGSGSTVDRSGGDVSTTSFGQGASSVSEGVGRNDDSFAGEISNDEASGGDNSVSDRA